MRLYRRHVEGLKKLRLEQFTDSGDLVTRQNGIRIREEPMGGKIGRVGIDGFPSLNQGKLLETEIGVNAAEARTARRQVCVELQARPINRSIVV